LLLSQSRNTLTLRMVGSRSPTSSPNPAEEADRFSKQLLDFPSFHKLVPSATRRAFTSSKS
jgi:hypothetical protein